MTSSTARAVVLLSGGLDSATALACARRDGFEPFAMSFNYGQKNRFEFEAAKKVAEAGGAREHRVVTIDLRAFGGSSLTSDAPVEKDRPLEAIGAGIPPTYVPARNTVFLSYALAWAEVLGAAAIYIGVNALDYSGYPDCRPEYIGAFEKMANLAIKAALEPPDGSGQKVRIAAPLIALKKSEIIRLGLSLGVDYGLTISCYDPSCEGRPCGGCDSCTLRRLGFKEAGVADPAVSG